MKKLIAIATAFTFGMLVTTANAGMGVGVSAAYLDIQADGTEVDSNSSTLSTKGGASNSVGIGSVFAEYSFDAFPLTIGFDWIPMSADVSKNVQQRTDTETSITDTATTTATTRIQKAQAEIDNHMSLYVEVPVWNSLYLKAGLVEVDVNTLENLGTGSSYGNVSIDGTQFGAGVKGPIGGGNLFMKVEALYTDYDEIKLTSGTNTITADLDTTQVKASLGFAF